MTSQFIGENCQKQDIFSTFGCQDYKIKIKRKTDSLFGQLHKSSFAIFEHNRIVLFSLYHF